MENLKRLRLNKRLTQKHMANFLNITVTQYQRYESGRSSPRVEDLIRIADYFGVSTDVVLDRIHEPLNIVSPLQNLFDQLSASEQDAVLQLINNLLNGHS